MRRRFLLLVPWLVAGSAVAQTDADAPGVQQTEQRVAEKRAVEPHITDLRLAFEKQQLLLSFKLLGAFDEDLRKRLDSGLHTGFTFDFELIRSRKRWFDKAADSASLQVGAMYNAVSRQYLINFKHDGTLIESRVVKDAAELEAAMTELNDFPVFSTAGKNPQQRFKARVRAELRTRTIFFFIPSTVHTDWAETRKFRLAEEIE